VEQITTPAAAGKSAASWPSIIAGAFVAASVTLILTTLGSGIGFASLSPWSHHGRSVTAFAITGVIWLILTQWIAAALGGYIAGRLRTRWVGTHTHEVFFRDTAHGLITWAVATIVIALVLSTSFSGAAEHALAEAATSNSPASAYSVDRLFRSAGSGGPGSASTDPRTEAAHIVANGLAMGSIPDADRAYLVDQVAARTGISPADAQARVDGSISSVMRARKAAAQASIYLALSMLIGAFVASVAAALGGRLRDEHI
jgi:hypothetical protein